MDDIKNVIALHHDDKWYFFGQVYDLKDLLKNHGSYWDEKRRCWINHRYSDELPVPLASLVTEVSTDEQEALLIETEKFVEKVINKATYRRGARRHSFRGIRWQALITPPEVETVESFVQPSYWNDLLLYLTPGKSRPCIALVGPAGNGKTTVGEKAFEAQQFDYVVIDCTEFIEPAELVGYMAYDPQKGRVWVDGKVAKAFREGKGVLLNEFDALNPRSAMCLQSALQTAGPDKRGRYLALVGNPDEDRIYPASECPVIITMNTYGTGATRMYVGRNSLDAATMDRITLIETTYENDAQVLQAHGWQAATAAKLATWARDVRGQIDKHALRVILSFRTLLRIAEGMELYGWDFQTATEKEFLKRIESDSRKLLAPPPAPPRMTPPPAPPRMTPPPRMAQLPPAPKRPARKKRPAKPQESPTLPQPPAEPPF